MNKTAAVIIASAIIWGIVLIAVASALKGTEYSEGVRNIIASGAGIHLIMLGVTARK